MTTETGAGSTPRDALGGRLADDPRVPEILDIFAKETGVDRARLTPDVTLASLGVASLDMVQAIFALETRFGIEIPVAADQGDRAGDKAGESVGEFETVGALIAQVLKTIDGPAP